MLHTTPLGRSIFAIGLNKETAFFSGIRVKRIKLLLYTLSGLICAGAGILWTFQYASARYDAGTGLELDVVTVVLFGGISIFGGKGTIAGVVMAVCVIGGIQSALTLINVSAQAQEVVTGCLAHHQRRIAQLWSDVEPAASQMGSDHSEQIVNFVRDTRRARQILGAGRPA